MTSWLRRGAGLAAVAALWSTLAMAASRSRFDLLGEQPISYLGTTSSAPLFSGGLVAGAALLVVFHSDIRARFPASRWFSLAMLAGLAGQVVAAVVPIGGNGPGHRAHTAFALLLGASLPVLMWSFAVSQPPGPWRRVSYGLFLAELAACGAGLVLSGRSIAALAEILPAAVFHIWIAAVTVVPGPLAAHALGLSGRPPLNARYVS